MPVVLRFIFTVVLCAVAARANPEADVRAAVQALREASSYTWETTARQSAQQYDDFPQATKRFEDQPKVIEVRGKAVADGYTEVVVPPSRRGVAVPVTAFIKSSVQALAHTPIGWLTRQEMRDSARRGETLPFEGKPVKLQQLFAVATRATNVETPADELHGLLADIENYDVEGEDIIGHLRPGAAAMLRDGMRRGGNTEGLAGKVIFRIREGALREYEVRLETEVPRRERTPIRRLERWTTSLSSIGATTVNPPPAVIAKLETDE